jgi:hypothetical protein
VFDSHRHLWSFALGRTLRYGLRPKQRKPHPEGCVLSNHHKYTQKPTIPQPACFDTSFALLSMLGWCGCRAVNIPEREKAS